MEVVEESLQSIDAKTFVLWIIAAVSAIAFIWKMGVKIYHSIEKYRKLRNSIEDKEMQLEDYQKDKEYLEGRLNEVENRMNEILDIVQTMQSDSKCYRKTSLHDKIFRLHRFVMNQGYISEDDLENFGMMTQEYFENGGNGIVKNKLVPEVLSLQVVYNDEKEDI